MPTGTSQMSIKAENRAILPPGADTPIGKIRKLRVPFRQAEPTPTDQHPEFWMERRIRPGLLLVSYSIERGLSETPWQGRFRAIAGHLVLDV